MTEPTQVEQLVRFGNALRREGLRVGTGAVADFCRAAALLPAGDLYWAGRATLVRRRDEFAVYDRVFRAFFALTPTPPAKQPRREQVQLVVAGADEPEGAPDQGDTSKPRVAMASRVELLRKKRFDRCTREELAEIAELATGFARSLPYRRSRRRRVGPDGPLDLPRTLRRALRTGGEPFERRYRTRTQAQRRLVLLLDVSGSMSGYARALLVLAHALLRAHRQTAVFCFGTRLTDTTRALGVRDPDEALRRAAGEVVDWEGGTRIGDALKEFLARAGHRGAARGAVVVVCSDGLDVGDPALLRAQMERLARLAHRVVWLNPLKQDPQSEPLARGMAAALPFVDVFASGHNLESLEQAARRLSGGPTS